MHATLGWVERDGLPPLPNSRSIQEARGGRAGGWGGMGYGFGRQPCHPIIGAVSDETSRCASICPKQTGTVSLELAST